MNLARYEPGRDGPFGAAEVAHLFRRGGFSLPEDELEIVARGGLDAALDRLFSDDEGDEARALAARSASVADRDEAAPLQALWFARLVASRAPAREKLALFWHGHFATSLEKVKNSAWMWEQYRLFREQGMGKFGELLDAIAHDPAMIVWLDGNSNQRGLPNENFARELMELFTLGLGPYSEHDVQEAARAFSGWHVRDGRFWLNARAHDSGEKEILGLRGPLDGGDVLARCAALPECAHFLAKKLLAYYVLPEPDEAVVAEFAELLRANELALEPSLRALFASQLFFSAAARGSRIEAPVEWCVGLLRRTRARSSALAGAAAAAAMGQALFAPPNVKGWDGDRAWINSRTLLERGRFAAALAYGDEPLSAKCDWTKLAAGAGTDAGELVDWLAQRLLERPLVAATRASIAAFAASAEAGGGESKVRRVAQLVMSAPEALLG